jgi:hypothetical protein
MNQIEHQVNALVNKVEVNRSLQEELDEVKEAVHSSDGLSKEVLQTVSNLSRGHKDLQKTVDIIDNRQRARNAVVYGISGDQAEQKVKKLLGDREDLVKSLESAHYIGKGPARPTLLCFYTLSSREAFLRLTSIRKFKEKNPCVFAVGDESLRTRVGALRLAAAAPELRRQFLGITIKRGQVRYKEEQYNAADFASRWIQLGRRRVDITAAAQKNKNFERSSLQIFTVSDF